MGNRERQTININYCGKKAEALKCSNLNPLNNYFRPVIDKKKLILEFFIMERDTFTAKCLLGIHFPTKMHRRIKL